MEAFYDYVTNPWTIVTFIVFVFWLWATWSSLNWKQKELERRLDKIEDLDLEKILTEIQINVRWVMEKMKEK